MFNNLKNNRCFILHSVILGRTLSVILGFIPRIHSEHTFLDPRVKPEDDKNKKSLCVIPEDDERQVKPEDDKQCGLTKGLDVVRQCAVLLERRVQSSTRVRKVQTVTRQTNPIGRSMIEMLGVLAIIGVLSVGGIAGYSSAMEKWKLNETLVGYNHLMYGLLEYEFSLRTLESGSGYYLLEDVISSLNLLPENWKNTGGFIYDPAGNHFRPFIRHNRFVFDVYIGNTKKVEDKRVQDAFSYKMCLNLMSNLLKPMHNLIYMAGIYRDSGYNKYLYGDSSCDNEGQKCLSDATLSDMQNICNSCVLNEEFCIFLIEF